MAKKVLRDGEGSKKRRKSPGVDVRGKGVRKAQLQQSRFRALREEELQGPPSRTRASLRRRLHEPSSTKPQVEKKPNQVDVSRNGDKKHVVEPTESLGTDVLAPDTEQPSVTQPLPEKHTLGLIIDTLQRKDIYEIFAKPVDPEEVKDYYEIIEEPMDFGTMRAKLHEGMYTSLEQFEHDVFLISGNAMHFNSSGTIFFRQAHGIHKLAKRVFHVLRTNPENFESEFSGTKRRSSRRSQDDFTTKSFLKTSEITRGAQDGGSVEADRRSTYKPHLDLNNKNCSKVLVCLNQQDHNYSQSLMHFVKDLGPTAQMVAKRKLQRLFGDASVSRQSTSQIPFVDQTSFLTTICTREHDPSVLTTITSNGNESNRNRMVMHMESQIRSPTAKRNPKNVSMPPHGVPSRFTLDLGFLKSKMNGGGESEMVRRDWKWNNNKDSSFTQQLHVQETSYRPFDANDNLALHL